LKAAILEKRLTMIMAIVKLLWIAPMLTHAISQGAGANQVPTLIVVLRLGWGILASVQPFAANGALLKRPEAPRDPPILTRQPILALMPVNARIMPLWGCEEIQPETYAAPSIARGAL
jgi:hypothetical protein